MRLYAVYHSKRKLPVLNRRISYMPFVDVKTWKRLPALIRILMK